jgi:hypothetical protein
MMVDFKIVFYRGWLCNELLAIGDGVDWNPAPISVAAGLMTDLSAVRMAAIGEPRTMLRYKYSASHIGSNS